ncbi:MAG TPA: hypothetical protein VIY08_00325 [Candidatus Nitrosocosmicus sp.]
MKSLVTRRKYHERLDKFSNFVNLGEDVEEKSKRFLDTHKIEGNQLIIYLFILIMQDLIS